MKMFSFEKEYLRDYLETLDWAKTAPGPTLPQDIIDNTAAKYKSAYKIITGYIGKIEFKVRD